MTTGQLIGTVLAYVSSPLLTYSWPMMCYAAGLVGLAWVWLALRLISSHPETHPTITSAEHAYIIQFRDGQPPPATNKGECVSA